MVKWSLGCINWASLNKTNCGSGEPTTLQRKMAVWPSSTTQPRRCCLNCGWLGFGDIPEYYWNIINNFSLQAILFQLTFLSYQRRWPWNLSTFPRNLCRPRTNTCHNPFPGHHRFPGRDHCRCCKIGRARHIQGAHIHGTKQFLN